MTTVALPLKPTLGGLMGQHPRISGKPASTEFKKSTCSVPQSPCCYQLQDPTKAQGIEKQDEHPPAQTEIKKFPHDKKELTIKELAEMVADHMEFHRMDMEFYLPDLQDPTCLVNILQEDMEFPHIRVVNHFKRALAASPPVYDDYSTNNMDLAFKAILS